MTLDRNLTDFHTEIEQAAFEPNNLVPGIGVSPDKMLLARGFSYADAHRARHGGQLQADPGEHAQGRRSTATARTAAMRTSERRRPRVRAELLGRPGGRPVALPTTWGCGRPTASSSASAYTLRADDDDFGQPGTMVREVMDDDARDRLVSNVVGHLSDGVSERRAGTRVRVLAQHRQGDRRAHRAGRRSDGRRIGVVAMGASGPAPGGAHPALLVSRDRVRRAAVDSRMSCLADELGEFSPVGHQRGDTPSTSAAPKA